MGWIPICAWLWEGNMLVGVLAIFYIYIYMVGTRDLIYRYYNCEFMCVFFYSYI